MKFDVIIGNPPFQSDTHNCNTNAKWKEFLKLATSISDTAYLILPDTALAPPTFSKYKGDIAQVNIDIKRHFNGIGSGFCSLFITKVKKSTTDIITAGGTVTVPVGSLNCVPVGFNDALLEKMSEFLTGSRKWNHSNEYESRKPIFTKTGKYEVRHTSSHEILRTDVHCSNNDLIRVSVDISGYPRFRVNRNMGLTQMHYWTVFDTIEEAEKYAEWGNSVEVQTFLKAVKWGGMNSALIIKNLR